MIMSNQQQLRYREYLKMSTDDKIYKYSKFVELEEVHYPEGFSIVAYLDYIPNSIAEAAYGRTWRRDLQTHHMDTFWIGGLVNKTPIELVMARACDSLALKWVDKGYLTGISGDAMYE